MRSHLVADIAQQLALFCARLLGYGPRIKYPQQHSHAKCLTEISVRRTVFMYGEEKASRMKKTCVPCRPLNDDYLHFHPQRHSSLAA